VEERYKRSNGRKRLKVTDRRNINRGFKKLHVWEDGVSLYPVRNNAPEGGV
jgi:hypothetical protein